MISEIAPLVIHLKQILQPQDLAIVDEPEAHLHPGAQIVLAELLARACEHDVRLVLATHSDYFLGGLSNAIVRYAAYEGRVGIDGRRVRVYRSSQHDGAGVTFTRVDVDPLRGIDPEEFASVSEDLFRQTAHLEDRLVQMSLIPGGDVE